MGERETESRSQRFVAAVESSLVSTWRELASASPLANLEVTPESISFTTGAPFPILNGVLSSRFPEGVDADQQIDSTLEYFRSRRLPMTWWTGPWSRPTDLPTRLRTAGLEEASREIAMATEPAALAITSDRQADFAIVEVEDKNAYRGFQDVLDQAFELPPEPSAIMYELICAAGFGVKSKFRHWLGLKDGRPVASITLSLAGGVAGIYNGGMLRDHHARGNHLAMVIKALEQARELDMPLAIVMSSRQGFNTFRSLGFEECCEVGQYVWTPPSRRDGEPDEDALNSGNSVGGRHSPEK